jgi:nitrile hydratase
MGCAQVAVTVHDSTADLRFLVLPLRPAGTEGWSEEALAALATRDSMVGVSLAADPTAAAVAAHSEAPAKSARKSDKNWLVE